MKHKIKKKSIEILFPIIALMEPDLFSEIYIIDTIWNFFKVIAILYIIISTFKEHQLSISSMQLISVAFFFSPVLSTLANRGDLFHAAKAMVPIMALTFYFDTLIRKYKWAAVNSVANLMATYVVINALFLIMFPNGFGEYIPEYTKIGADSRLNFIGGDNRLIYFFIFTIAICILAKGAKSKTTIFIMLISFGSMMFVWSGTGVVGILLFAGYLMFVHGKRADKIVKFFPLTIIFTIVFALVVVYNVQELFSNFIVSFLHKDITFTGRTYLWARALELITKKPILGYGITETYLLESHGNYYSQHNIILQIMMIGGCIQIILFILLFVVAGRKLKGNKFASILSASIFIYMICSLTEATMLSSQLYLLLSLAWNVDYVKKDEERTTEKLMHTYKDSMHSSQGKDILFKPIKFYNHFADHNRGDNA